jgi:hypothetical protein
MRLELPKKLVPRQWFHGGVAPGGIRTCDTGFNSRPISTIAAGSRLMLQENGIRVLTGLVGNRGFASILVHK